MPKHTKKLPHQIDASDDGDSDDDSDSDSSCSRSSSTLVHVDDVEVEIHSSPRKRKPAANPRATRKGAAAKGQNAIDKRTKVPRRAAKPPVKSHVEPPVTVEPDHKCSSSFIRRGATVHVPCIVFPDDTAPSCGYWVGKTVKTNKGGACDIGILIDGEPVFTRSITEVAVWVVPS